MSKNYKVLAENGRYTIGEYDEGYGAYIVNDGICNYYWWDTEYDAQAAADAYNNYDGCEWLGQHGYGNDIIPAEELEEMLDTYPEMVKLYELFNAVEH